MFTNRQLRERRKKVFEIISIVKLLTVFFSAIVILCSFPMGDSIGTELDVENINVTLISFLCIGVLLLCYEIWTRVTKEEIAYKFSFKGFIEVSLFIALITFSNSFRCA